MILFVFGQMLFSLGQQIFQCHMYVAKKTTSNIHVHDFDDEAVMLFFHTFHVVEIISQTVDIHILHV